MFPEGRIFDFLLVGAVALIVVGPKDLPVLMRKVGQFMARVRGMAAEFRASFDELARQSELDELRKEVEALRLARPQDFVETHLGAGELFSGIRQDLDDTNAALLGATMQPALPGPDPEPEPKRESSPDAAAKAAAEAAPPELEPEAPPKAPAS